MVWADSVESAEERAKVYLDQIIQVFSQGFSEIGDKSFKQEVIVEEVSIESEGGSMRSTDVEHSAQELSRRPVLIQAILTAATLALVIAAMGSGWRQLGIEIAIDKKFLRLAFLIAAPFQIWLALVSPRMSCLHSPTDYRAPW